MDQNIWSIHVGEANAHADWAMRRSMIGIGWNEADIDLSDSTGLEWKAFKDKHYPAVKAAYPGYSNNQIGRVLGPLFSFANQMQVGDLVVLHLGNQKYQLGKIAGGYRYERTPDDECSYRHRRSVTWLREFSKDGLSEAFKNSLGAILTLTNINRYESEIAPLLGGADQATAAVDAEANKAFGLESFLQKFIAENWGKMPFAKDYAVYEEDGDQVGIEYPIRGGRIDILAKRIKGSGWLVIELKKGKTDQEVFGQLSRYMGYVIKNLAEGSEVKGMIISFDVGEGLRDAVLTNPNVSVMTYEVDFRLKPT